MRGDFIEQEYGGHAGKLRRQPRMSKHQTDQQGLLLAGGTKGGRHRLGAMLDDQIGAMWTFQRAARRPVACAPIAQGASEILFKIERRLDTDSLLQRSFQKAVSLGKRSFGGQPFDHRRDQAHGFGAGGCDGRAQFSHLAFYRIQPLVVTVAVAQQPVAAAHRPFIIEHALAVRGIDGEHHTVQKTPPVGSASREQPIHRRHHPENARIIEQIVAGSGNTVDADLAATLAAASGAGADLGLAIDHAIKRGMNGKAIERTGACDIVISSAAQAAPRRQKGNRFDQIGLAGAVFAGQHHVAGAKRQRQFRIVAEIDKLKPPDRNAIRAALIRLGPIHFSVL